MIRLADKSFIMGSLLFFFILSSCNYQAGYGDLATRYSTISIPYVEGDVKGGLTSEVIRKVSSSGAFQYTGADGDLVLEVKLIELQDTAIGFRYDRNTRGKLKKSIIPTEMRLTAVVEIVVRDSRTNEVVLGPTKLSAKADFDHSFYSSRNEMNIFSLGQLSDIDAARDAVMQPLNQALAEQIVNYMINSW